MPKLLLMFASLVLAFTGSRVLALSHDLVAETERVDALEDAASLEVPKATATRTVVASESSTKASHGFENEQRRLDVSVSGNTAGAPSPAGYPLCGECANGCPSKTYAVVGTGGEMTATTCGLEYGSDYESGSRPGYDTRIVVYEGSSCSSLRCIGNNDDFFDEDGIPLCGAASRLRWASVAGLTYRIQVTGFLIDSVGTFNLAVLGSNGPLVEVPGCSGCIDTTYPVYDAVTDSKVLTLVDGGQVCIPPSYNIEAALCQPPQQTPSVLLKLADASCVTLKRQTEDEAPYFLWGNKGPNVLPNTRPLPDGGYYLYTKVDGVTKRIRFTQCCNANGCAAEPFAKQCSLTI